MTLLELAAMCEKAEGPDGVLDMLIARVRDEKGKVLPQLYYTTSIDAALTLVPEGWLVASLAQDATGWWTGLRPAVASVTTEWTGGWGPTPSAALAICAAALRARAATEDRHDQS